MPKPSAGAEAATPSVELGGALPALSIRPAPGVTLVPIRHHSPVCAAALSALIAQERPAHILVEMPEDFESLIPLLLDGQTRPPVAIVSLATIPAEGDIPPRELSGSYPFSVHSPEFIAIREGIAAGATVRFIDLPAGAKLNPDLDATDEEGEDEAGETPLAPPVEPLADDTPLDLNAFVDALADRLGCRDGFEVWDQLFEQRLGSVEPTALFTEILAYCAAIRASQPHAFHDGDPKTLAREAAMAAHLCKAMADGGPILLVTGGYHAPPLAAAAERIAAGETFAVPDAPTLATQAFLTRFGMKELDGINRYAAGLPMPGYYDALWQSREDGAAGAPDFSGVARDALVGLRQALAGTDLAPSLPATVEAIRLAEDLAALRGRSGPLRTDILDAARTAFVKGEAGRGLGGATDPTMRRLAETLVGSAIGNVPPFAGSPPLLESVRRSAIAFRFDVEDGSPRTRDLQIRTKARHARQSAFLHGLALLDVPFAHLQSGPDLANGRSTHLVNETWRYAWSHAVEAALVTRAALGSTLAGAVTAELGQRFDALARDGQSRDAGAAVAILAQGLVAGVGQPLAALAQRVERTIADEPRFVGAAAALSRLVALTRASPALTNRNQGAPLDITKLTKAAYRRVDVLLPSVATVPPERTGHTVAALRDALLAANELGEGADFVAAVTRIANNLRGANPGVAGATLTIAATAEREAEAALVAAVKGSLAGVQLTPGDRVAVLSGALKVDPSSIWQVPGLFAAIDDVLTALDEDAFMEALPDLRLTFTALNPRESDRVAELAGERHGIVAAALRANARATLEEAAQGSRVDALVSAALDADGLRF